VLRRKLIAEGGEVPPSLLSGWWLGWGADGHPTLLYPYCGNPLHSLDNEKP
jgi:hypothetical protein